MDPFIPHEIFSPYAKPMPESESPRTDNTPAPACPPQMVSKPGAAENKAKLHQDEPDTAHNALQAQYQDLPTEIRQHLLALHLAGKSPEQCLAALRNYALVSRAAYAEVRHFLAEPEFLQAALQSTRHAVPELAILPWKLANRQDEIARRMHQLAATHPQLYADLSRQAKVPRRVLNPVSGWLPGYLLYHQPFSKIGSDRPTAIKALLESRNLTFLQLRLDEDKHGKGEQVSDDAVCRVCEFLSKVALGTPSNLQLHLECRFIARDDAVHLLHQLSRCAGTNVMHGLNLQGSLPDPESAHRSLAVQYLADFLAQNSSLRQLNLSGNGLSAAETSTLVKALMANIGVTELHLADNNIGQAGAIALAGLLSSCPRLRMLALENNHITEPGADALNAALKLNTTLEQLYLGDNPIRFSPIWRDEPMRLQNIRSAVAQTMPPATRRS